MKNPVVTIEMENGDIMKAELYPEIAPNTVNNFISLIKKGFYDGLIFHRVIKGFMIQGGCPNGNGMGGPGYTIKGEFSQNGFTNNFKHTKGVLSMARAMDPNSAGSQFFIMHETSPHLDGQYASFGKVVEGLDIVDKIAGVRTDWGDRPLKEQKIKNLDLSKRSAELELKKLKKKVGDGVIKSTVEGVVKEATDEASAKNENKPVVSVVGEEGFYVTGRVGETMLDQIKEGMTATVMYWKSGEY